MEEQIRLLCVDDEENVLRALKRLFLDTDYEIITAPSGHEGLEILKNTMPIQVVISDYRMPTMNGVDFLREVYRNWPDTVRIVLSGYADTASIVEAINEGHIYKFIPKPWNDDELKVSISNALDRYFIKQKNNLLTRELEAKNKELIDINNNLERAIEKRTSDLMLQNRILTCSQNILDALPVAVMGIDPDGQIVQCNTLGLDIFAAEGGNILGTDRRDSLPKELNSLIEDIVMRRELSANIQRNGAFIAVRGVYMKHDSGQEGIILVLERKGRT